MVLRSPPSTVRRHFGFVTFLHDFAAFKLCSIQFADYGDSEYHSAFFLGQELVTVGDSYLIQGRPPAFRRALAHRAGEVEIRPSRASCWSRRAACSRVGQDDLRRKTQ